jgi:protein-L-isoaspartate(D-aspartate) O-methyltransferase
MSDPEFTVHRRAMIDSQLRTSGISQPWVVSAMGAIAREKFVPESMRPVAYMDRSINAGPGRKLSPPVAAAMLLEAAEIVPDDNILLIGAATGYLSCLIASRAESIVAVEDDTALAKQASEILKDYTNITISGAAMTSGAPEHAPYSLLIIDGAIAELPHSLIAQLKDGGRVVTGLAQGSVTRLASGIKRAGTVSLRPFADTEIAILPGFAKKAEFVF